MTTGTNFIYSILYTYRDETSGNNNIEPLSGGIQEKIQIAAWKWVLIATAIYMYFIERWSLLKHLEINI